MKIGILGGGQLSRLLCLAGSKLGHEMHVLSPNPNDPAASVTRFWMAGNENDQVQIQRFIKNVDVCTFESEFIDPGLLKKNLPDSQLKKLQPSVSAIEVFRDRKTQKEALLAAKIPTSPFLSFDSKNQLIDFLNQNGSSVVKKRTHGYDGFGTFFVKKANDLDQQTPRILDNAIVEKAVSFRRELAITAVRDQQGCTLWLPLVEWQARDKKCWWVQGPTQHKQIKSFKKTAEKLLKTLDYVGALTFELFDCGSSLLVNEVAPRVHNSAHYTIDALEFSQFDLHLAAISGSSLKNHKDIFENSRGYAMVNLVSVKNEPVNEDRLQRARQNTKKSLYWYGKSELRQGRKMGHITALSSSSEDALKQVLKDEKEFWKNYGR